MTSDPASSTPRPSRRRRFATPGQTHPGQPLAAPSEAKSSRLDHSAGRPAAAVPGRPSATPAAAPAARSSRRLTPSPSMRAILTALRVRTVRVDHVIYATGDLDGAAARIERELGVAAAGGGRHERIGTHNRIVPLDDGYIELLAI